MILFRVNGKYIELESGFDLGFAYVNSCFAFDKMQLSRSAEFVIPATPINNAIFGFANEVSRDGDLVRIVFANTQMYYDGGVITGNLQVNTFDAGSGYKAIFVYGELTILKKLKEAGTIDTYCTNLSNEVVLDNANIKDAYHANGVFNEYQFGIINYINGVNDPDKLVSQNNLSPSVSLSFLMFYSSFVSGVNIDYSQFTDAVESVGIILASNKNPTEKKQIRFQGSAKWGLTVTGDWEDYIESSTTNYIWAYPSAESFYIISYKQQVNTFTAIQDITVTRNTGNISVIIMGNNHKDYVSGFSKELSSPNTISNDREIQIKKGQKFTLLDNEEWGWYAGSPNTWFVNDFDINIDITLNVSYTNKDEIQAGGTYYLAPNVPKVTLLDIIKTYANLLHCGVVYDKDTNTISFFDFAFNKGNAKKLEGKVVSLKSIDRRFLDYAQLNMVKYKSEEYVISPGSIDYPINNITLDEEKVLFTIPFNDGDITATGELQIKDFDVSVDPNKKTSKIDTICIANNNTNGVYLKHISQLSAIYEIPNTIDNIIKNSTTVKMKVKMTNAEFLDIKNTDCFEYRSVYYCLMDGKYKGCIAELTLCKI